MLSFLTSILAIGTQPLSLVAGLCIGYLFHKDWKQLAWPLLLFIVPGIGGLDFATQTRGVFYLGAVEFIAVGLLASASFWAFEYSAIRRRSSKQES